MDKMMKCIEAEKYLPLYVRSDLGIYRENLVSEHLQNCNHCSGLADEYRDAQQWMRLCEPPEFSDEFFDGIRHSVLNEINKTYAPVGLLQFRPFVYRKSLIASSIALLIIFSAVTLYLRTPRSGLDSDRASLANGSNNPLRAPSEHAANLYNAPTAPNISATLKPPRLHARSRNDSASGWSTARNPVSRSVNLQTANAGLRREQTSGRGLTQASVTKPWAGEATKESTVASVAPRDTLRIEMQTADPNIRIIWFAPRETIVK